MNLKLSGEKKGKNYNIRNQTIEQNNINILNDLKKIDWSYKGLISVITRIKFHCS